ncbi:MAG: glycosyltransferase family 2 protein [Acidobacteriota bacterium]|nr:glycosyltransferase family 2 protein [Acidobacteriota bacterium]
MSTPRVVIGAPLYNHAGDLPETLESLLIQSCPDFRLVCVDDQSTDGTGDIVCEYAKHDSRITYWRNSRRLGMIDNWRQAFDLAMEEVPGVKYFAWASDHDIWHPRWLQTLVEVLDGHPNVVLAYPRNHRIGPDGLSDKKPWKFETVGLDDLRTRFRLTMKHMSAGNMIYGLGRADAIRRAGVFRRVLVPDRLLLMELALEGQFRQVPEVLWFRRWYGPIFSLKRQRRAFFPDARPLHAFVPWWIGHAAVLTWALSVHGERRPRIGRVTGLKLGARYLRLAGVLHARQQLKQLRVDLFEHATFLKPAYVRYRGAVRRLNRRWEKLERQWRTTVTTPEGRRKLVQGIRGRFGNWTRALVFPIGRVFLRALRALPLMRTWVIPWLAREEINQVPSGPEVFAMRKAINVASSGRGPIIVGPWLSEVGFEVLYWIPFLAWATKEFEIARDRLIVVSRGGAHAWYLDFAEHHEDIFSLMSIKQFRKRNDARWQDGGNQKQMASGAFDEFIINLVRERRGLTEVQVLHPSIMYRLLRYYWYEKGAISLLNKHTAYRSMPAIGGEVFAKVLPHEYIAVRFYFRPSFPDTSENRELVGRFIRGLAKRTPVVILNTGLSVDDHQDFDPGTGMGVHTVDHLMTPTNNLEVQSAVIGRARAFVGTYGGLSYLGPFYGVPTIGLFSNEAELVPTHLDVSRRLSRHLGAPLVTLNVKEVPMVEMLCDAVNWADGDPMEPVGSPALASRMPVSS